MTPNKSLVRIAPLVTLAGTLFLVMPAFAGQNGEYVRQMRLDNPGLSHRQVHQLIRSSINDNRLGPDVIQPQAATVRENRLPLNDITGRMNRLNGQSAFLNDRGTARAISNGLALDLTSAERSIVLGENLFSNGETRTINVGGEQRTLSAGSKVSAAEYVALQQIINGNSQALTLDSDGKGVGGQFSLNSISDSGRTIRAAELVIPEHVTASGDFSRHSDGVRVTNDLINYGTLNAFSSSRKVDTAIIGARDIDNASGATISTSAEKLNLSLRADRDINNAGSISSSGNLELFAGRSINNTGAISSNANITLTGNAASDLTINNTGGTISALSGAINVRPSNYDGIGNTTITGGDLLSRELNLFTGKGTTDVVVNQLTGVVSSSGTAAHVSANTETLKIGSQCLIGDPTYYNTANIDIGGDIIVGEELTIISGGSIICTSLTDLTIKAQDLSGKGYNITLVAGANVVAGSGEITPAGSPATLPAQSIGGVSQNTTSAVSFSTNSATGGSILLNGVTNLLIDSSSTSSNLSGGNITLAAFADSSGNLGQVVLPNNAGSSIKANGFGTGNNGSVSVFAGGTNATTIILPTITNSGGSGVLVGSGSVSIVTAQPITSNGNAITYGTNGAVTSGNSIVPSAIMATGGKINLQGITSGPSSVLVQADAGVDIANNVSATGGISGTKGGNIDIRSNGEMTINGTLDVRGANVKGGGSISVISNSTNPTVLANMVADGGSTGGDGGSILITNTGTGGTVLLNATLSANAPVGSAGIVSISTTNSTLVSQFSATISTEGSTRDGTIDLRAANMDVVSGDFVLSAENSTGGEIDLFTNNGGITITKNLISAASSGTIKLDLANDLIRGFEFGGPGGKIYLEANQFDLGGGPVNLDVSAASGKGSVTYIDHSSTPTFVNGAPSKPPKSGVFNLVNINASNIVFGDRGDVTVRVGGPLTVNPAGLNDVAFNNGGNGSVTLQSGFNSTLEAPLVVTGSMNFGGNGFPGAAIALESNSKKAFVINLNGKTPKNGVNGLITGESVSITNNIGGIQIGYNNSISAANINLTSDGSGKITTKGKTVLSAFSQIFLNSATADIKMTVDAPAVGFNGGSDVSLTLNDNHAGGTTLTTSTAKNNVSVRTVGQVAIDGVQSTTKGSVSVIADAGAMFVNGNVGAVDGSITIQSNDLINGFMNIADNVNIITSGTKGGAINIAIGSPKKVNPVSGTIGGFTISNLNKGQVYFGANPGAIDGGTNINLTADAQKLVISNSSADLATNRITFGNNITVTAGQ